MSSTLFGCFVGRSFYHFTHFDTISASFIGVMIKRFKWVFVDTLLIIIKVHITLVDVYVAIRNTKYFFHFIHVHFDLDYPIDFLP